METPPTDASPPLVLDEYVSLILKRRRGEMPRDETISELLDEVGIGRSEEEWIERGAPEVLYNGVMWEPKDVTEDLSDACLAALGLACVLRAKHQLRYWRPMIDMGLEGRFRGHLSSLEETRDMIRAVARRLIDRPDLMRKLSRLQPRLAESLVELLHSLPNPVEDERDREILIPHVLSEEDVPTGDDEEIYARDTVDDEEDEEVVVAPPFESATALPPEDAPGPEAGTRSKGRSSAGMWIGVFVVIALLGAAAVLALKLLG